LVKYPVAKEDEVYAVPPGVKVLGASAIANTNLLELTIPESVIRMENWAVKGASALKKLRYEAVGATNVTAFSDTLEEVTFGEKVVSIPGPFFENNTAGVETIDIPESVTTISATAQFTQLRGLKEVMFRAAQLTSPEIFYDSTNGMPLLKTVKIGDNVRVIQSGTFRDTGVDYVDLRNVTTVGSDAFRGCTSLTGLNVPVTNTGIGSNAFGGCTSLTAVVIHQYGVSIEANSFRTGSNTFTLKSLYEDPDPTIGGPGRYVYQGGGVGWYKSPN
jgi:hypothetical protein